jgi:hypothetical protein
MSSQYASAPPFHYNWAHLVESKIIVFILKTEITSHPEPL